MVTTQVVSDGKSSHRLRAIHPLEVTTQVVSDGKSSWGIAVFRFAWNRNLVNWAENFNVSYNWSVRKFPGKARARSNCNEKFTARNKKFSARNEKFFYLKGKTTAILGLDFYVI